MGGEGAHNVELVYFVGLQPLLTPNSQQCKMCSYYTNTYKVTKYAARNVGAVPLARKW